MNEIALTALWLTLSELSGVWVPLVTLEAVFGSATPEIALAGEMRLADDLAAVWTFEVDYGASY